MPVYKYKKEIVAEYGWDRKTLYNRLRKCDLHIGRGMLSPAQQKGIYECLGYPPGVEEKDYEEVVSPEEDDAD
jgi:hypothetical protein